jgi:hypothetical protein
MDRAHPTRWLIPLVALLLFAAVLFYIGPDGFGP